MHRSVRRGFSLLELMLVLAIVVAITAMAIPALSGPLENQRLRQGANQVRASWLKSRAKAMEKGRTFVFRYSPGSSAFTVEPWLSADDYLESDQLLSLGIEADGDSLALANAQIAKVETLPENITFIGSETASDVRADVLAASNMSQTADAQSTSPIFFYPDGTTSTARLIVGNRRQRYVVIAMRGLTGVVQVSPMRTPDELSL